MTRRLVLLAFLALSPPLAAQIGQATDILTGVVTSAAGQPLEGAQVEVLSLETQIRRTTQTNASGRYTVLFTDGGGQYRVTIRYPGMQAVQALVQRYADEDRLVFDAVLNSSAITLEPITVLGAPRPVRLPDAPTPGSIESAIPPELAARLPIDDTDLNILATLVPGVVGLDGTDSTGAAFSVAGLRPDANAITMDGMSFGSGQVPQEGLRTTRVVTSTYDVARGQFSGGLIATTSRSGSNVMQGSLRYGLRDDDLAFPDESEISPTLAAFTQHQVSLGIGGPLVRDRLFAFISGQSTLRRDAQLTLLNATTEDLIRLGVHPDSVARFTTTLASLGVAPDLFPPDDRGSNSGSALLRVDWVASDAHTLTFRGDWQGSGQEPTRVSTLGLPQTGGTNDSWSGGGMAALTSRIRPTVINEIRVYTARGGRESDPLLALPAGRVRVLSELDGGITTGTLAFGGNAGMPTANRTSVIEATDELSVLPGDASHRLRLGVMLRTESASGLDRPDALGTYTYLSLDALAANQAAQFRRNRPGTERSSSNTAWAAWFGDVWRHSRALQLTLGLRLEGGSSGPAPEYNPVVDSAFGRRTDRLPSEWHLSPRVGFTWMIDAEPGPRPSLPRWILRGGVGEYRSPLPNGLLRAAQTATGLQDADAQVLCVGAGVPQPDWSSWLTNPAAVPTDCASGPPVLTNTAPGVTVFADGFGAPRSWRATLGLQHALTAILRLSVDGSYTRGVNQYALIDLNLPTMPAFTLDAEARRPVYVPVGAITAGGTVASGAARPVSSLGQVLEVRSGYASESRQLTTALSGVLSRGTILRLSWTWSDARDQGSGLFTTTAGDPAVRDWGPSDFERPHSFLATVTRPFGVSFELTGIGRLSSGAPYTPIVDSDVNGDGARNDRAFVTPEAAALGFACLARQAGTIAERNSCRGPWQSTFDLQANWRPNMLGLSRRLSISLATQNLLRGGSLRPDPVLLAVTGFDPGTEAFQYQLNERFGSTRSSAALRAPFQISLSARLTIGPDRQRAALDQLRGAVQRQAAGPAQRAADGRAGPGAAFADRMASLLANPAARVLALDDSLSLGLDSTQRRSLASERDSLTGRLDVIADSTRAAIERVGQASGPQALLEAIRPRIEEGWRLVLASRDTVRALLREEQWSRLPEDVREPRRPGVGGRRP